ncbi:MAG: hypothetical protein QM504_16220 [Pseudomonadota bacterium]
MDMDNYRTYLDAPALGMCLYAGILLYRTYKHYSAILVIIGFTIVAVAYALNSACYSVAEMPAAFSNYPYLCHPSTFYLRGVGYFIIAYGLIKFIDYLKTE